MAIVGGSGVGIVVLVLTVDDGEKRTMMLGLGPSPWCAGDHACECKKALCFGWVCGRLGVRSHLARFPTMPI